MERNSLSIWQPIQESIPQARTEHFSKAGHIIMLDAPAPFKEKLIDLLDKDKPIA